MADMTRVVFETESLTVDVPVGTSILEAAHRVDAPEGSHCGGVCACCTCHVRVLAGFELLNAADEIETDLLDMSPERTETSRLGCQARSVAPGEIRVVITDESFETWLDQNPQHQSHGLKLRGLAS